MANVVGKILEEGFDWITRGVEAGLEKNVVENIVKNGNASAQRQLKRSIIQGEQKAAVKSTERFVQESVEKNTIKQADKQAIDLILENDKVSQNAERILENNNTQDLNNVFNQIAKNSEADLEAQANAIANGTTYTASEPVVNKLRAEIAPKAPIQNDATSQKILDGLSQDSTSSWNISTTEIDNLLTTNSGELMATARPAHIRLNENSGNELGNVFSYKGEKFSFLPDINSPIAQEPKAVLDGLSKNIDKINTMSKETPWGSTARAALGTAVAGGALMAALSSSRGQQNNAQLYGQQPLY